MKINDTAITGREPNTKYRLLALQEETSYLKTSLTGCIASMNMGYDWF
jgi:hypothetical protein